jgi:YD repeat-containing protein
VPRRPLLRLPRPQRPVGTLRAVLAPLPALARGLRRIAAAARRGWRRTPRERRGPLLLLACGALLAVVLVPHGVPLAALALVGTALVLGRTPRTRASEAPADEPRAQRLRALYEALVPYFAPPPGCPVAPDAGPHGPVYVHGGDWRQAFGDDVFDADGRLARLVIRYPPYFTDGEPAARARVERVVHGKSGRGREYRFTWDEEGNAVTVTVLSPLPLGLPVRCPTAPGEAVLGHTDPADDRWSLPVVDGGAEAPHAVVWRAADRTPHLLAVGDPGSGTSTLLRSLALQAVGHADVLVADGAGTGAYASLAGRDGVLGVENGLDGVLKSLAWAAQETQRRLPAARAGQESGPTADARALWLLVDRPALLADLAAAEGREDPVALLGVPLRQGRAAGVTVVVAEEFGGLERIPAALRQHLHARVVLGSAPPERIEAVLGAPPHTTPPGPVPPGRGYVRLGAGPVLRLQVPAAVDQCAHAAGAGGTSRAPRPADLPRTGASPLPGRGPAAGDLRPAVAEG